MGSSSDTWMILRKPTWVRCEGHQPAKRESEFERILRCTYSEGKAKQIRIPFRNRENGIRANQ